MSEWLMADIAGTCLATGRLAIRDSGSSAANGISRAQAEQQALYLHEHGSQFEARG